MSYSKIAEFKSEKKQESFFSIEYETFSFSSLCFVFCLVNKIAGKHCKRTWSSNYFSIKTMKTLHHAHDGLTHIV